MPYARSESLVGVARHGECAIPDLLERLQGIGPPVHSDELQYHRERSQRLAGTSTN